MREINVGSVVTIAALAFLCQLWDYHKGTCETTYDAPIFDTKSYFNFSTPSDMNKYGIFTTIIVQIEFKADEKVQLWRTNTKYADEAIIESFHELCSTQRSTTYGEDDFLNWSNCTFNENQITALMEVAKPELWNKNFTYIEIKTKSFSAKKKGIPKSCILNEFPLRKAYIVMMGNSFKEGGDKVSEPINKLDAFMPFALNFFEGIIEVDKILQFYPMDFLKQTKHYKCLLAIASGNDLETIKSNCKFKCNDKMSKDPIKKTFKKRERIEL